MAALLAQQKLIPFFGAGVSRPHLGFTAAELAHDMAKEIDGAPETLLSQISDDFVDKRGEEAFVEFLKKKLVVSELDDTKASTHRLLLSLDQNLLYTANQDNIFELTAAKYGRPYRRIVTLNDLSASGQRLLIKFHGDTDVPSSLVFGDRSYQKRMATENHPLDIKLRADLLGKRLLFLGYSFSDENVAKLLQAVQKVFAGTMPPSYLIAFEYTPLMAGLEKTYGIRVIDPRSVMADASTSAEAFERCLKQLCDRTIAMQAELGLDIFFSGDKINPRMATDYEVRAVSEAIRTESFENALRAFRAEFDDAIVSSYMEETVTELFQKLTDKVNASDDNQMSALRGALMYLELPPAFAIQATAFLMAAFNRRPPPHGFDMVAPIVCRALPDKAEPAAAALAVAVLLERGEPISDNFRRPATSWFQAWEKLSPPMSDTAKRMIDAAWQGSGFQPVVRPTFLPGFHEIRNHLLQMWPVRFKNPEE
jgi:SIR2-like domain